MPRRSRSWPWPTLLRAAFLATVAVPSSPDAGHAASLREALTNTYQTNPALEAGRAQLRATDESVNQALAGYRPQIFIDGALEGARGEIGRSSGASGLDSTTGGVPRAGRDGSTTTKRTTKQIGLSVRQSLYAGGATGAGVRRAESQVSAQRANLLALEQDILLQAVDAYSAAWRDKAVLDLALNNEQRLRRQLDATRERFDVGEVARTDVAQAEARLSRARADVESAKAALAGSRATYRRVIGTEPGVLEDPRPTEDLPRTLEDALSIAASGPIVTAANFDVTAAREAIAVVNADLLPSVDLTGDLTYANQPTSQQAWQREASVGVQLSVPLYQGGAEYSRIRQAKQQAEQARNDFENTRRQVQEEVAATYDQLLATRAAIRAFRDEARANQVALDGVQQEQTVGSRTVLDVLDAEQELFQSRVDLVRARRDEVITSYQLKAAVGQLTVADLGLGIETYDPKVYYERNRTRLFGLDAGVVA
ncbi:MAG TPA: TolC family outer membrane protein, partial [Geminicoccaceae bacterium]